MGMQLLPHLFQNGLKRFNADLTFEFIEHFHKSAHVRALEMMRQVDIHIDGGIDRLRAAGAIKDNNRIFDIFYTDFFNVNIAEIFLVLNINHNKIRFIPLRGTRGSRNKVKGSRVHCSPSTIHYSL